MSANDVDHVRVSQSSRRDARPKQGEVESFLEEYKRLCAEKATIETNLAMEKTARLKEQMRIRREAHPRDSLRLWLERRAEMDAARTKMLERTTEINKRIAIIKFRAQEEKRALSQDGDADRSALFEVLGAIREVLTEIRDTLRAKSST